MRISQKSIAAIALCAWVGATSASVLVGFDPFTGGLNGAEADPSNTAYTQAFTAPSGATLDKIVWWGYRGFTSPGGPYADDFTVKLGAVTQTGNLTTALETVISGVDLIRYTLVVSDAALTATALTIVSNGPDFEWNWQSTDATALDNPDYRVAFRLEGTLPTGGTTPEPGSLALVALAGLALLAAQRRRVA